MKITEEKLEKYDFGIRRNEAILNTKAVIEIE